MSEKVARGYVRPQDLQRTTACVQSRAGRTEPSQAGQRGVLAFFGESKKNIQTISAPESTMTKRLYISMSKAVFISRMTRRASKGDTASA